jgi:hypothetical protein
VCLAQVLRLRDELELKVDVLSLPVDICVQHALQGNSALQGALNVALRVLQDIEDYEANLRQQEIDTVSYLPVLFSPAISLCNTCTIHHCCLITASSNSPE